MFPTMAQLINEGPEERLAFVKKQFPGVNDTTLQELLNDDPTGGKYLLWMAKMASEKHRTQEIGSAVIEFHLVKQHLQQKDLNKYKDPQEVLAAAHEQRGQLSRRQKEKLAKKEGSELVYDSPALSIYHIKEKAAACLLGAGTKWCIAGRRHNMFDSYNKRSNIYYVFLHTLGADDENHKIAISVPRFRDKLQVADYTSDFFGAITMMGDNAEADAYLWGDSDLRNIFSAEDGLPEAEVEGGFYHLLQGYDGIEIADTNDSHMQHDEFLKLLDDEAAQKVLGIEDLRLGAFDALKLRAAIKDFNLYLRSESLHEYVEDVDVTNQYQMFMCLFAGPWIDEELLESVLDQVPNEVKAFAAKMGATLKPDTNLTITKLVQDGKTQESWDTINRMAVLAIGKPAVADALGRFILAATDEPAWQKSNSDENISDIAHVIVSMFWNVREIQRLPLKFSEEMARNLLKAAQRQKNSVTSAVLYTLLSVRYLDKPYGRKLLALAKKKVSDASSGWDDTKGDVSPWRIKHAIDYVERLLLKKTESKVMPSMTELLNV